MFMSNRRSSLIICVLSDEKQVLVQVGPTWSYCIGIRIIIFYQTSKCRKNGYDFAAVDVLYEWYALNLFSKAIGRKIEDDIKTLWCA